MPTVLAPPSKIAEGREVHTDVPVYLGFKDVAELAGVKSGAIRFYYYKDIRRGEPHLMAKPDILLTRGEEVLPGWELQTALDWIANRRGTGNHTYGEDRVGYKGGSKPKTTTDADTDPE